MLVTNAKRRGAALRRALGRESPGKPQAESRGASGVDAAAREAQAPTEAQREAGNYPKGHCRVAGCDVAIENKAGSKRRPEWPALKSHYGYFKGTVGKDKDHVDVFIKPGTPDDYDGPVYVVNQRKKGGGFDEHKVMLGWPDEKAARAGYLENYTPGWDGVMSVATFGDAGSFRAWLRDGNTKAPAPSSGERMY